MKCASVCGWANVKKNVNVSVYFSKQKAVAWYWQKTNLAYFAFPRNEFEYKLTIDNINFYDDTDDGDDSRRKKKAQTTTAIVFTCIWCPRSLYHHFIIIFSHFEFWYAFNEKLNA